MRRQLEVALCVCVVSIASPAQGSVTGKLVSKGWGALLARFGYKAGQKGTQTLARKLTSLSARHGDDAIRAAVQRVGPTRAVAVVSAAGGNGKLAARVLSQHGARGAAALSRPGALRLMAKHSGADVAGVMVRHPGVAQRLVTAHGRPAISALTKVSTRNARRLAMLQQSGSLAKMGRTPELLDVVGRYGNKAMSFVWKHRLTFAAGAAGTAALAAFLADPEPYLNGLRDITEVVARPLAEGAGKAMEEVAREGTRVIARRTQWTVVLSVALMVPVAALGLVLWRWRRRA